MIFGLILISLIFSAQAFEPCEPVGKLIPDENSPGFYQCTNWGWQAMPCPTGLCFNPAVQVCDWPSATERCGGGNHSYVPPCHNVGDVQADPKNCHNFYQCCASGWVRQKCGEDFYFNPEISACDRTGPHDTCDGHGSDDESDLVPCTKIGEIRADTKHCDLYYECTDCGWSLIECGPGQLFNRTTLVCDKASRVRCGDEPCDKIGEHKQDPKHCDLFFECTKCGWALVPCKAGLYFNPLTSACDKPENVKCANEDDDSKLQPCDKIGELKADSQHCDHYYKCTTKGWAPMPCEQGTLFDANTSKCEAANQVDCGGNNGSNTTTIGPFEPCDVISQLKPDPKNCNKFYECTAYGWQNMPCYGNLVFNPNINECDYAENYKCIVEA